MKNLFIFMATALVFMLFPAVIFSQSTIYVATNGVNASGRGSVSSPYQTPQYAVNSCKAGDTIVLRGGAYNLSSSLRISKNNITIRSYPNEWAILNAPINNDNIAMAIYYNDPSTKGGTLERLEIAGGNLYAIKFESNWDWGENTKHGTSNITIKHCKIHDSGRDCIKITPGCSGLIFENCEIYNSGKRDNSNAEGIDCVNGSNIVIRNCYIHNIATNGIYLKGGARDGLIESNLLMDCGTGGILLGFKDTDAEWFDPATNPDYFENINGTVINNIIVRTQDEGIGLYASSNAKVYNNTIIDAAPRYHAALYISRGEVWISDEVETIYPPNKNVDVRNNIFMNLSTAKNPAAALRYENDDPKTNMTGTCIVDYNIYYKQGGATFNNDLHSGSTFDLWKTNTKFDTHSKVVDPKLSASFHLTSASVDAIDKGSNIASVLDDYDGDNRTATYDIGADEYIANTALPTPPAAGSIGTGKTGFVIVPPIKPPTGINDQPSQQTMHVFPNPTFGLCEINLPADHENISIAIYSYLGTLIKTQLIPKRLEKAQIDLSTYPPGIYLVKYIAGIRNDVEKIVKK